ncbi:hypothetical protein RJ640_018641 [Escallonia rubra]|uniref:DNA polymerase kappa n=1 Tax=Escallonia rubra TaxID=112253 RepID=A0AA88UA65_9ASTE|nr:hypothetical protein RJ640_018641 [Escallonia rubra]
MAKSDTSGGDSSRPWQSYHTVFTNAKAGMEGVDKEKVQRIVYEMSKGSKFFENEERKEADMRQKIDNMRDRCAKLTAANIAHYQKVADKRILELESTRDLSRLWLHVDMDAFYAAVETLSNPLLRGKPMAVGSMSMISTANYEARRYGVRAAMPGFIARKLCPELIFVPTDFKKYTHYSDLTRKVFYRYDPNFIASSLDEAYLDITKICKERGITSGEVAEELRASVNQETGLTCSAGVAPNRLLAKVCSDINKPNGQFVLPNNRLAVITFVSSLPIRKVGGIGKVTEHVLKDVFRITTCDEMLQKSCYLCALFSQSSADFFLSVGLGLGRTDTPQVQLRKSISNERTFSATENEAFLYQKLVELADMLSADMEKESLYGRTLTLKLKTASFEVRTRALTLHNYTCSSEDILKHASKLLKAELPVSLRLIGLRMSQFSEDKDGAPSDPTQKTLSNFVLSGDSCGKNMGDGLSCDLHVTENLSTINTETTMNFHETCYDIRDPSDGNQISDHSHNTYTSNNDSHEMEIISGPLSSASKRKVIGASTVMHTPNSCQAEASRLPVDDSLSLSRQYQGSSLDKVKKRAPLSDDPASSSNQKEPLAWVDDYKCSLCGVELPPSFLEERQEHSDFHFAERLQEEESCNNHTYPALKQRFIQKEHIASKNRGTQIRIRIRSFPCTNSPGTPKGRLTTNYSSSSSSQHENSDNNIGVTMPTMYDILDSSKAQKLELRLQTLGPFFRITAKSLETQNELGRAEGLIRVWLGGKILHLDSIRLRRETLGMEKSIFGIGLFIGAVAIRYGYDCGCRTAELLAINDSDLYHSKLVRFYTRIGFKSVYEVTGSNFGDFAHMLVWGGVGTRMEANVQELLVKWCTRFSSQK